MTTIGKRVRKRVFGAEDTHDSESQSTTQPLPDSVGSFFDAPIPPAYNRERDQSFTFEEQVTITSESDAEFATVTIETIREAISFPVRITEYTTRFGTLDVEFITVGGYSVNLYHPKPESDTYFVRKLFYYGDTAGVDSEGTWEDASEPHNPIWSREDMGSCVETTNDSTHLTVYDWRQNMMTHGKPTPQMGEIVLQYKSSLEAGGNRQAIELVLQSEITTVTGVELLLEVLTVGDAEFIGYGRDTSDNWWRVTVPISSSDVTDRVTVERTENPRIHDLQSIVWTRYNRDSWAICQPQRTKSYID